MPAPRATARTARPGAAARKTKTGKSADPRCTQAAQSLAAIRLGGAEPSMPISTAQKMLAACRKSANRADRGVVNSAVRQGIVKPVSAKLKAQAIQAKTQARADRAAAAKNRYTSTGNNPNAVDTKGRNVKADLDTKRSQLRAGLGRLEKIAAAQKVQASAARVRAVVERSRAAMEAGGHAGFRRTEQGWAKLRERQAARARLRENFDRFEATRAPQASNPDAHAAHVAAIESGKVRPRKIEGRFKIKWDRTRQDIPASGRGGDLPATRPARAKARTRKAAATTAADRPDAATNPPGGDGTSAPTTFKVRPFPGAKVNGPAYAGRVVARPLPDAAPKALPAPARKALPAPVQKALPAPPPKPAFKARPFPRSRAASGRPYAIVPDRSPLSQPIALGRKAQPVARPRSAPAQPDPARVAARDAARSKAAATPPSPARLRAMVRQSAAGNADRRSPAAAGEQRPVKVIRVPKTAPEQRSADAAVANYIGRKGDYERALENFKGEPGLVRTQTGLLDRDRQRAVKAYRASGFDAKAGRARVKATPIPVSQPAGPILPTASRPAYDMAARDVDARKGRVRAKLADRQARESARIEAGDARAKARYNRLAEHSAGLHGQAAAVQSGRPGWYGKIRARRLAAQAQSQAPAPATNPGPPRLTAPGRAGLKMSTVEMISDRRRAKFTESGARVRAHVRAERLANSMFGKVQSERDPARQAVLRARRSRVLAQAKTAPGYDPRTGGYSEAFVDVQPNPAPTPKAEPFRLTSAPPPKARVPRTRDALVRATLAKTRLGDRDIARLERSMEKDDIGDAAYQEANLAVKEHRRIAGAPPLPTTAQVRRDFNRPPRETREVNTYNRVLRAANDRRAAVLSGIKAYKTARGRSNAENRALAADRRFQVLNARVGRVAGMGENLPWRAEQARRMAAATPTPKPEPAQPKFKARPFPSGRPADSPRIPITQARAMPDRSPLSQPIGLGRAKVKAQEPTPTDDPKIAVASQYNDRHRRARLVSQMRDAQAQRLVSEAGKPGGAEGAYARVFADKYDPTVRKARQRAVRAQDVANRTGRIRDEVLHGIRPAMSVSQARVRAAQATTQAPRTEPVPTPVPAPKAPIVRTPRKPNAKTGEVRLRFGSDGKTAYHPVKGKVVGTAAATPVLRDTLEGGKEPMKGRYQVVDATSGMAFGSTSKQHRAIRAAAIANRFGVTEANLTAGGTRAIVAERAGQRIARALDRMEFGSRGNRKPLGGGQRLSAMAAERDAKRQAEQKPVRAERNTEERRVRAAALHSWYRHDIRTGGNELGILKFSRLEREGNLLNSEVGQRNLPVIAKAKQDAQDRAARIDEKRNRASLRLTASGGAVETPKYDYAAGRRVGSRTESLAKVRDDDRPKKYSTGFDSRDYLEGLASHKTWDTKTMKNLLASPRVRSEMSPERHRELSDQVREYDRIAATQSLVPPQSQARPKVARVRKPRKKKDA